MTDDIVKITRIGCYGGVTLYMTADGERLFGLPLGETLDTLDEFAVNMIAQHLSGAALAELRRHLHQIEWARQRGSLGTRVRLSPRSMSAPSTQSKASPSRSRLRS
jgi:hypothetical protein